MKTAPSRPNPEFDSAVRNLRRALMRDDRHLFDDGEPRHGAGLDELFFHLWDQVLLMVLETMATFSEQEVARLERLSDQLTQAQARRILPPRLVREILPKGPHGTVQEK